MKKYNIMGFEMAKMEDVKWCIRDVRRDIDSFGSHKSEEARDFAKFILELVVRNMYIDEIRAAETDEERAAILEMTGDFVVVRVDGSGKNRTVTYFEGWSNGEAMMSRWGHHALKFDYESMAKHTAEKLGEGWTVMDTNPQEAETARRMIDALLTDNE